MKLTDRLIDVHIGLNAEYTITYRLYDHRVAQRLWQRQLEHGHSHEYVSRYQFYGWGETEQDIRAALNHSVEKILELRPDIVFNSSDNLNELHVNFPDLVRDETDPEMRHWLSMFNYHIHHLEDATRHKYTRIITCANANNDPEPLQDEDYDLFTTQRVYGGLYMNYPHIGKHIAEMYFDQDTHIPADHVVPTSVLKNDFFMWFSPSTHHDPVKFEKHIHRWLKCIEDKLPYPLGHKRLAIGYIPLGILDQEIHPEQIAKHKFIHSILARLDHKTAGDL